MNHYKTLGVRKNATKDSIAKAYRKKAARLHPDLNEGVESDEFKALAQAYETLSDPERRAHYDATGEDISAATGISDVERIVLDIVAEHFLDDDLFRSLRSKINSTIREITSKHGKALKISEKLKKRIEKLETANAERSEDPALQLITGFLKSELNGIKKFIDTLADAKAMHEDAIELVKNLECPPDVAPVKKSSAWGFSDPSYWADAIQAEKIMFRTRTRRGV